MIYPDPLPFPLVVLRTLTASLKQIVPANGYQFNMADFDRGDGVMQRRVFRGRAWFGASDPIPMISVLEGASPADELVEFPTDCPAGMFDWPLLIQGFVDDDPENPTDPARLLLADIRRRLIDEATRKRGRQSDPLGLGRIGVPNVNRVHAISVGFGTAQPADDISAKAYCWLPITVRVVDHAEAPYA